MSQKNYVFFSQPLLSSSTVNQISGKILIGEDVLATVDGHWVRGDCLTSAYVKDVMLSGWT